MRQATPGETLIGPATGMTRLRKLFQRGLLEYWSAVSVHPYRQTDPERSGRLLVDSPIDWTYAPPCQTRSGMRRGPRWSKRQERDPYHLGRVGLFLRLAGMMKRSGRRLGAQWLTNAANGMQISIWYDWHDDDRSKRRRTSLRTGL